MSNNLPIYLTISEEINKDLNATIETLNPDKMAVLVDENTREKCLPLLHHTFDLVIEIKSGETEKTLKSCDHIWNRLTGSGFTRKSLLVNLGGGVIGDMGGFAAATYKRGMSFINIPTTLLSQVDASIGGKLGVDFNGLKNHIGFFQEPDKVIVFPGFLETLPQREMKSGFAEIIKHALIKDENQWKYLLSQSFDSLNWEDIIPKSISIKNEIVNQDPREKGLRKILNYGHTIGHAIETYFLKSTNQLLHGEAVALGMILENEVAMQMGILSKEASDEIRSYLGKVYEFSEELPSYGDLKMHLIQDKKNDQKGLRFSLLKKVGTCKYDVLVEENILRQILK
jgi:3-dehydroquinate synthase